MTEAAQGNFDSALKFPEIQKTKEKLSDERLGNLVSAVGNHEAKAITLILMRDGNTYNSGNLYNALINSQGEKRGWITNKNLPFTYCSFSLSPIGLVAKEIINPDLSTYGFAITKEGQEMGIPLAGLLLDFSERHNTSLNKLFGSTVSRSPVQNTQEGIEFKKRSPTNAVKVLYEIVTSPHLPIRETDIARETGITEKYIQVYLERLAESGLIQYKQKKANESYSLYKLSPNTPKEEQPPPFKSQKTLTNLIFNIFKENPDRRLTSANIYNLLPPEIKEKWKKQEWTTHSISSILAYLARNKYLDIENFHYGKVSEIDITDDQRTILTELIEIIDKFQNQDREILEKGKKLATQIISNPQRVSNLLRRAKEASGNANRSPVEETVKDIFSILYSHPEGLTNRQIRDTLEQHGKNLVLPRIAHLTHSLEKQDLIKVIKEGSVKKLFSKQPQI